MLSTPYKAIRQPRCNVTLPHGAKETSLTRTLYREAMDPRSRVNENDGLLPEAQRGRLLSRDGGLCVRWLGDFCRLTWCLTPKVFINLLIAFVPLGIMAGILAWNPKVVFIFNILALLPLAKLLSSTLTATSERLYPLLGVVLKATIGNSVLLIVSLLVKNNKM